MGEPIAKARALVFDVEGTLIDCVGETLDCWEQTLGEFGERVDRETLQSYSGCDGNVMLEALLPQLGKPQREQILQRHAELYVERYLERTRAFPGMHALFETLKCRGHLLALATTCKRAELDHYDRLLDVVRLCSAVECGSDIKRGKPHPDLFAATLKKLGVPAAQALAVGDTPYDAVAAGKCGISAIGVLTGGFTTACLGAAGCVAVFDSAVWLAEAHIALV